MIPERFLVGTLILLASDFIQETKEAEYGNDLPYNHHRIQNDPNQVKPDKITGLNLFAWLNPKNSVRFKLWTRKNPQLAHEIKYNNLESLRTSNFDPRRLTKIIVHGFGDTATEAAVTYYLIEMRDAYLSLADVNLIIVDYSILAIPLFYYTAFPDTVGARLGEFLDFLVAHGGLDLDSVHIIGFSWGSHVAGLAGYRLKGRVGRISGLDPAGPTFHHLPNELRLDRTDAQFVDIIHTNGGRRLWTGGHFGIFEALGHVDIYPNGGQVQIGCPKSNPFLYRSLECSHGRAVRYFIESITSPVAFPSCPCESLEAYVVGACPCHSSEMAYMGEHLSHKTRGIFQLITKSRTPFGQGPQMNVSLPSLGRLLKLETGNDSGVAEIAERHGRAANSTESEAELKYESRGSRSNGVIQEEDEAVIGYKNSKLKLKFKNTFNTKEFPNEDVIQLCQAVLENRANSIMLSVKRENETEPKLYNS